MNKDFWMGIEKTKRDIVINMISEGFNNDIISKITKLSDVEIDNIKTSSNSN